MNNFEKATNYIKRGKLQELQDTLAMDPQILAEKDAMQRSLLHIACLFSKQPTAEILISAGADINSRDRYALTPLDRCFQYKPGAVRTPKSLQNVKSLIEAGGRITGYRLFDLLRICLGNQALADCIFNGKYQTEFVLNEEEAELIDQIQGQEEYDLIKSSSCPLSAGLIYHFIDIYNWDNGFELIDWLSLQEQFSVVAMVQVLDILAIEEEHFVTDSAEIPSYNQECYILAQAFVKSKPELLEIYQ